MILVVGGAGYLGSHISTILGTRCMVYDNLTYRDEFLNNVPFVTGDVTDHEKLKYWLDQSSVVIWLAAIVGDGACMLNPGLAREVNVDAVRFLADNFSGPIVFTSTASVYGINEAQSTEKSPLNPQSLYAETKVEAEKVLALSDATILRMGTLHGLSDRMRFDLVVNVMTRDGVMGGSVKVFGGKQRRPLLHVADAAKVICRIASGELDLEPGVHNLSTQNMTVDQVARTVCNSIPNCKIVHTESEHEDNRDYGMVCSFTKMGIRSISSVRDSVAEIARTLRSGRIRDPYSARYVNAKIVEMQR